jgi:hypothetical protein
MSWVLLVKKHFGVLYESNVPESLAKGRRTHIFPWEVPDRGEGEGDCWIHVCAGNVAYCIHHYHDHDSEG